MSSNFGYKQVGDYRIPDLMIPEQSPKPLGKYGMMRERYLKERKRGMWNAMLLNGTLPAHLLEIDETANTRLEQMMPKLAAQAGATEQLKASDPMKWVGMMTTCKAQAEEIILTELIYA